MLTIITTIIAIISTIGWVFNRIEKNNAKIELELVQESIDHFRDAVTKLRTRGDKYRNALDSILNIDSKNLIVIGKEAINIATEARKK